MVKKGDLLAVIDPRPYEAALLQAQGQLSRDSASLKNARLDLVRYQKAYKDHAIPEQQLATQQALVDQDVGIVQLDQGNLERPRSMWTTPTSFRRSTGESGCAQLTRATSSRPTERAGLRTITQLQPITVIFTIAEDDLDRVTEQMATGRSLKVLALDRSKQHQPGARQPCSPSTTRST